MTTMTRLNEAELRSAFIAAIQQFCHEHNLRSISIDAVEVPDLCCDRYGSTTSHVEVSAEVEKAGADSSSVTILNESWVFIKAGEHYDYRPGVDYQVGRDC